MKDTYKVKIDIRDLLPSWFGMYRAKTILVLAGDLEMSQIEQIEKWLHDVQRIQPTAQPLSRRAQRQQANQS